MKHTLLVCCLIATINVFSQTELEDKKAILWILKTQENAWNHYDLKGYMQGYWKSDSLKFYGANGVTNGWQKTWRTIKMPSLQKNIPVG